MLRYRQNRLKLALVFVLAAGMAVALAFAAFVTAFMDGIWAYVGVATFAPLSLAVAVAAAASAMQVLKPATLTADEHGVVYVSASRERRIGWNEIERFIVFTPDKRLRSLGCELKSGPRKFVSFGRCWDLTAEEMAATLEKMKSGGADDTPQEQ